MLQAGIHPRIAILHCGLFSDPEQVYQDSKPYLEAATTQQQQDTGNFAVNTTVADEMLKAIGAMGNNGGDNSGNA